VNGVAVVWMRPTLKAALAAEESWRRVRKKIFLPTEAAGRPKPAAGNWIEQMSAPAGVELFVVKRSLPPSPAATAIVPLPVLVAV
jgi:hypothetical protein